MAKFVTMSSNNAEEKRLRLVTKGHQQVSRNKSEEGNFAFYLPGMSPSKAIKVRSFGIAILSVPTVSKMVTVPLILAEKKQMGFTSPVRLQNDSVPDILH